MKRATKRTIIAAAVLACFAPNAPAEESIANGAGQTASARLNFRVVVPAVTRLRIGAAGATVTEVSFDLAGVNIGDGVPVPAMAAVPVEITTTNSSPISVMAAPQSGAALFGGGPGDQIAWSQIAVTSSGAFSHNAPTLANSTIAIFDTSGAATYAGSWAFSYKNETVVPASAYTGTFAYTVANP